MKNVNYLSTRFKRLTGRNKQQYDDSKKVEENAFVFYKFQYYIKNTRLKFLNY